MAERGGEALGREPANRLDHGGLREGAAEAAFEDVGVFLAPEPEGLADFLWLVS